MWMFERLPAQHLATPSVSQDSPCCHPPLGVSPKALPAQPEDDWRSRALSHKVSLLLSDNLQPDQYLGPTLGGVCVLKMCACL